MAVRVAAGVAESADLFRRPRTYSPSPARPRAVAEAGGLGSLSGCRGRFRDGIAAQHIETCHLPESDSALYRRRALGEYPLPALCGVSARRTAPLPRRVPAHAG